MKKHKVSAIKLFFLFATLGAFPFLYPAMQMPQQNMAMNYDRSFDVRLAGKTVLLPVDPAISIEKFDSQKPASQVFVPIDPALGSEIKPDPIE